MLACRLRPSPLLWVADKLNSCWPIVSYWPVAVSCKPSRWLDLVIRLMVPARALVPYSTAIGPLTISTRSTLFRDSWLRSTWPLRRPRTGTPSTSTVRPSPPKPFNAAPLPRMGSWLMRKLSWLLSSWLSWEAPEAAMDFSSTVRIMRSASLDDVPSRSPVTTASVNSTQRHRTLSSNADWPCPTVHTASKATANVSLG